MIAKKTKPCMVTRQKHPPCVLSGFIFCSECGKPLVRTYSTHKGVKYNHMICSTYKKLGATHCTNHLLSEQKIVNAVLTTINRLIDTLFDIDNAIKKSKQQELSKVKANLDLKVSKLRSKLNKISNAKQELYMDYKDEILSKDDFLQMKSRFDEEYNNICDELRKAEKDLSKANSGELISCAAVKTFQAFKNIDVLTKEVLSLLVDKIIVDQQKHIRIIFKFKDDLKAHLSYFDSESFNNFEKCCQI